MNINSLSTVSAKPVVVPNLLHSQPRSPTLSTHCNSSFNILPFVPDLFCQCHCIDYDQPPTPVGAIPLVTLWLTSIISIQAAQSKNHFSPCLEKPTVDISLKFHAPRLLHVRNNYRHPVPPTQFTGYDCSTTTSTIPPNDRALCLPTLFCWQESCLKMILHRVAEVLYHSCFLVDYCWIMTKIPAVIHIFYFCCTNRIYHSVLWCWKCKWYSEYPGFSL